MTIPLIAVTSSDYSCLLGLLACLDRRWTQAFDGMTLRIGRFSHHKLITADDIRDMLRIIAGHAPVDAVVTLIFSDRQIPVLEIDTLLTTWEATGEPPVLSLISLVLGSEKHVTQGLRTFIGHELAASFNAPDGARDAARNLVRLARHALMHGTLVENATYVGVDDLELEIAWADGGAEKMVTTILPSVRNGSGSG